MKKNTIILILLLGIGVTFALFIWNYLKKDAVIVENPIVTIEGQIIEHNTSCYVDNACSVTVKTAQGTVEVFYHWGDTGERCLGTIPSEEMQEGDRVRVYAEVINDNALLTCSSSDYFIEKVE